MRHLHVKTTAVGFHHGVSSRIPLIATSTVKAAVNCCTESLRLRDAPMRPPSSMIGVKAIPVRRMVVVSTPTWHHTDDGGGQQHQDVAGVPLTPVVAEGHEVGDHHHGGHQRYGDLRGQDQGEDGGEEDSRSYAESDLGYAGNPGDNHDNGCRGWTQI